MSTPTFTNLDIGLPGGAKNPEFAQSTCRTGRGPLQVARSSTAFVGLAGTLNTMMGPRKRAVTWRVVLRCATEATLRSIELSIDALLHTGAVGTLTDGLGHTYQNAVLQSYAPNESHDTIQTGELAGWVRRAGTITFDVLTP